MKVYWYRSSSMPVLRCLWLKAVSETYRQRWTHHNFKQVTFLSQKLSAFVCLSFIYHLKLEIMKNQTIQIWRRSYCIYYNINSKIQVVVVQVSSIHNFQTVRLRILAAVNSPLCSFFFFCIGSSNIKVKFSTPKKTLI